MAGLPAPQARIPAAPSIPTPSARARAAGESGLDFPNFTRAMVGEFYFLLA